MRVLHSGPDTTILTPLCAACPYGPPGCCAVPPRVTLSDVGRIVARGGRDWLLEQLAAGRITAHAEWLIMTRDRACTYLGETGCTVAFERRPATCNYYVCERALEADDAPGGVRRTRDDAEATYARWDAELARRAAERWPQGLAFDGATLDWLGAAFAGLSA